jgi:hypothetical protein
MKIRYLLCIPITVFFLAGFIPVGFAQSSQCTVAEKQGSLVTITCPGEGTQVLDMSGSADIYKVGDTIDTSKETGKGRSVRPKVR